MNPSEVAASYDSLAQRWSSAGFDRTNGIAQHMRALQFVQRHGKALDVGCGSSGRFIDLLIGQGFDVEGLDLSAEMLRLARLRHPHVVFHHADICTWTAPLGIASGMCPFPHSGMCLENYVLRYLRRA